MAEDEDAQTFSASWRMTLEDFTVLTREYHHRRFWSRMLFKSFWVLVAVVVAGAALAYWHDNMPVVAVPVIYLLLLTYIRYFGWPRMLRRSFEQQELGDKDNKLSADVDWLFVEDQEKETRYRWFAVKSVQRLDQHTILWLSQMQGITLPDRAFATVAEAAAFASFAERQHKHQKG